MAKKMSYVDALTKILDGEPVEGEIRERIEALRESQMKRNSTRTSGGETKEQRERKALAEKIYEAMEPNVVYGSVEIAALVPDALSGATPQKITPLMKLLEGRVTIGKSKGKNTYTLAPLDEGEDE